MHFYCEFKNQNADIPFYSLQYSLLFICIRFIHLPGIRICIVICYHVSLNFYVRLLPLLFSIELRCNILIYRTFFIAFRHLARNSKFAL